MTHRDEIFAVDPRAAEHEADRATGSAAFDAADIWAGPVYGYADLVDDPQITHNGTFVEYDHPTEGHVKTPGFPIRFTKTPSRVERGAPLTGEHTREILAEIGWRRGQDRPPDERACDRRRKAVSAMSYTGLTWDHPRGYVALENAAEQARAAGAAMHVEAPAAGGVRVPPDRGAGAPQYDLIVLDHPHIGDAVAADCLQPLESLFDASALQAWKAQSIGNTFESYLLRRQALGAAARCGVSGGGLSRGPARGTAPCNLGRSDRRLHADTRSSLSLAGPHAILTLVQHERGAWRRAGRRHPERLFDGRRRAAAWS